MGCDFIDDCFAYHNRKHYEGKQMADGFGDECEAREDHSGECPFYDNERKRVEMARLLYPAVKEISVLLKERNETYRQGLDEIRTLREKMLHE